MVLKRKLSHFQPVKRAVSGGKGRLKGTNPTQRNVHEIQAVARTLSKGDDFDVAAFRARAGVSQSALAKFIGVSLQTVDNWEHARRTMRPSFRLLLEYIDRYGFIKLRTPKGQ